MKADLTIIGGGVIGSSIAFNLLQDGFKGRITVLERDSSYQFASSALAFGGVRQQFTSAVNVRMAQYSLSVITQMPECQFRQRGLRPRLQGRAELVHRHVSVSRLSL